MIYYISNELSHHGVKGMKWGVRKQRQSLGGRAHRTMAGIYGVNERFWRKTGNKTAASMQAYAKNQQLKKAELADKRKQAKLNDPEYQARVAKAKKAAKVGAAVAATALAAYGGYKVYKLQGSAIDALSKSYIESGKKYIRAGYKGRETASYIMNNADKAKLRGSYDTMRLQSELGKYTHKMADNDINTGLNYINKGNNKDFTRREVASEMINQVKKRKR